MAHIPVLLQPTIEWLNLQPGEKFVDGTINRGGHARKLCQFLGPKGLLIGIDTDGEAIVQATVNLKDCVCPVKLIRGNFRNFNNLLDQIGVEKIDAVLLDLGFSSNQMDDSGCGFSFQRNEPLMMTLSNDDTLGTLVTAEEAVNDWAEESLADIIYGFGEEHFSRRIAKAIVEARAIKPIKTTSELVAIIEQAVPIWYRKRKLHPATKTFQALRIAVNDELGAIQSALPAIWQRLNPGGRLAVISFHSLEARIVKDWMREKKTAGEGVLLTKKAVKPDREEELANPRSRSAQLRVIKKVI
ncbi:MAG: 16S rRNA (cytosine(1402)-N(4))-methyltransferase [Candidatus Vogelbacteria bacterium RIFOXYD2_FULL_44_9]|uniref:Ribosomal RNA small subunit methyltransferase H n=1 Tax=Candidatus Vogelbacteria bacterium RIFOXYD2_FULL_44_9 TaxID=1802441 RepID=A0A1G2QQN4_9BACT|nr:MAG: 16S rRNA (cytosine(1402)-N(4))-methyltransferase [Candidatus Vogelbacteria bacterium RIFOXYD2_FULL_44_9]